MTKKPRLAIIMDGGLVQAIVSNQPTAFDFCDVIVIDYDVEGSQEVPQSNGTTQPAILSHWVVAPSDLNLEDINP